MSLEGIADAYRLSSTQEGMLYHTLAAPDDAFYMAQVVFDVHGDLDQPAFEAAWHEVVNRHDALKTSFLWEGLDEPLQVVHERICMPWRYEDWRALDSTRIEQFWSQWLGNDRRLGFNLSQAPLMRLGVARTGPDSYRVLWSCHHILADGWSTPVVLREVMAVYGAHCGGPLSQLSVPLQYREFVSWHYQQDRREAESFWRSYLQGADPICLPRTLQDTHAQRGSADRIPRQKLVLSLDASNRLCEFARKHRLTLTTLVQGAWGLLLSRYADSNDVMFGTTVSGRSAMLPGSESGVGLYLNTLPTRIRMSNELELMPWLAQIQNAEVHKREFESTPLVDLRHWGRMDSGQTLFESVVAFESHSSDLAFSDSLRRITLSNVLYHTQSNYALSLLVLPGSSIEFAITYDASRFGKLAIARMLHRLVNVLNTFVRTPATRIGDISLLTDDEVRQLTMPSSVSFNYPRTRCVHELFEDQVDRKSNHTAIIYRGKEYSFGWLEHQSNALANTLRQQGVQSQDRVGILLKRSPNMLVAILGILKAGAAYVPLDVNLPSARCSRIIADAAIQYVVGGRPDNAQYLAGDPVHFIYEDSWASASSERPVNKSSASHCAYVMYTSGSTGEPKGVCITHGNVVHSTWARFTYYDTTSPRFLLLSSYAFDSSVAGIYWALAGGGTLILPELGQEQDVAKLRQLIHRNQVSHLLCLPSLYELLLAPAEASCFGSLKTAIVAGEACSPRVVETHRRVVPHAKIYNEYGPTEGTVWCTAYRVPDDSPVDAVPIGRPVGTAQVLVLDGQRRLVPPGVPGEIYIGGEGLADGYLHRPELSAACFVPHPWRKNERLYRTGDYGYWRHDGELLFYGRADQQIKIRGHRIELEEIRTVLAAHPQIADAAVLAHELDAAEMPLADQTAEFPQVSELVRALEQMDEAARMTLLHRIEQLKDEDADVINGRMIA